ncbi:hypothetical protein DCAR_0103599 [Daucus carota subsp. sativus]|uniref:Glutathione S-transferase 3, mitochondrial n=1 Tax=Daucus carota subsp. sativus TaxID=79200 RepID=A0A162ALX0_DAUCS|nr:PREDICTED: microsomal glutathione S-transferase 3-like [Daucus carota subsp. sativus]WOG84416.1 hypothetical protein DCAR_0103599 [Daucus carota subsp. sativus]
MGGVEVLPREYGYVALILGFAGILNFWMSFQVNFARKKYDVQLPTMYALESENKNAKLFNCVQRGHQNSLEYLPMFFIFMTVGGIKHPIIAALLGCIYVVARYFYFIGYSTGDPKNRLTYGFYNFLALMGLILCTISSGVEFLLA